MNISKIGLLASGILLLVTSCDEWTEIRMLKSRLPQYCEWQKYSKIQCSCMRERISSMDEGEIKQYIKLNKLFYDNLSLRKKMGVEAYRYKIGQMAGLNNTEEQEKVTRMISEIIRGVDDVCSTDFHKFIVYVVQTS